MIIKKDDFSFEEVKNKDLFSKIKSKENPYNISSSREFSYNSCNWLNYNYNNNQQRNQEPMIIKDTTKINNI